MKLGAENRKQVITLAVLGVFAIGILGYEFWPASTTAPAKAAASAAPAKPATRRLASGKIVPVVEPRLIVRGSVASA